MSHSKGFCKTLWKTLSSRKSQFGGGGGAVGGGRWWGWDEAGFLFDFERDEVGAYYLQFNETFTSEIYKCMFCFSGSKTVAMLVIKITLVKFY